MRILLDCRPLQSPGAGAEKSRLIFAAVNALSAAEGTEWILLFDSRYRPDAFPGLPGEVAIRRALPGLAGWRYWYDRQIPRLAKQKAVDQVWLTGGISGLRTVPAAAGRTVPVCVWMPERVDPQQIAAEHTRGSGLRLLYRRGLRSGLKHAAAIICYSNRDREWLMAHRPDLQGKIEVLHAIPDETIKPLHPEEKERIKTEHTQGMEYFFADVTGCGEGAVVSLLKEFSFFKKRQQSRMRLVLTGNSGVRGQIAERLSHYKYRHDVDWSWASPPDLAGAAYAVILLPDSNGLGTTLLNRWAAGVPVIAASGGLMEEMSQGAVLQMSPEDPASLAAQLMRIYKEEDQRTELIGKGFERLKMYSHENFLRRLRVITEIAAC